jgi:hypothetical protein
MADYSTLLRDRVTLAVRSVDRVFLQGYVPHLQTRHRRGQMFFQILGAGGDRRSRADVRTKRGGGG